MDTSQFLASLVGFPTTNVADGPPVVGNLGGVSDGSATPATENVQPFEDVLTRLLEGSVEINTLNPEMTLHPASSCQTCDTESAPATMALSEDPTENPTTLRIPAEPSLAAVEVNTADVWTPPLPEAFASELSEANVPPSPRIEATAEPPAPQTERDELAVDNSVFAPIAVVSMDAIPIEDSLTPPAPESTELAQTSLPEPSGPIPDLAEGQVVIVSAASSNEEQLPPESDPQTELPPLAPSNANVPSPPARQAPVLPLESQPLVASIAPSDEPFPSVPVDPSAVETPLVSATASPDTETLPLIVSVPTPPAVVPPTIPTNTPSSEADGELAEGQESHPEDAASNASTQSVFGKQVIQPVAIVNHASDLTLAITVPTESPTTVTETLAPIIVEPPTEERPENSQPDVTQPVANAPTVPWAESSETSALSASSTSSVPQEASIVAPSVHDPIELVEAASLEPTHTDIETDSPPVESETASEVERLTTSTPVDDPVALVVENTAEVGTANSEPHSPTAPIATTALPASTDSAEIVPDFELAELAHDEVAELALAENADPAPAEVAELALDEVAELAPGQNAELAPDEVAELALAENAELAPAENAELAPAENAELAPGEVVEPAPAEISADTSMLVDNPLTATVTNSITHPIPMAPIAPMEDAETDVVSQSVPELAPPPAHRREALTPHEAVVKAAYSDVDELSVSRHSLTTPQVDAPDDAPWSATVEPPASTSTPVDPRLVRDEASEVIMNETLHTPTESPTTSAITTSAPDAPHVDVAPMPNVADDPDPAPGPSEAYYAPQPAAESSQRFEPVNTEQLASMVQERASIMENTATVDATSRDSWQVRLDPPGVDVQVVLTQEDGKLSAVFHATEAIGAAALQSRLGQLRDALQEAGFDVSDLEVLQEPLVDEVEGGRAADQLSDPSREHRSDTLDGGEQHQREAASDAHEQPEQAPARVEDRNKDKPSLAVPSRLAAAEIGGHVDRIA